MHYAVIDIGTNSVLMVVAEVSGTGEINVMRDEARITRLGEGFDLGGKIGEPALQRTVDTLLEYVEICKNMRVENIHMLGTEIFRCAEDSQEVQDAIQEKTGYQVAVLSGEEEAKLSFQSALPEKAGVNEECIVIDIGGGSTEIIAGSRDEQHFYRSLKIGAVTLTAGFLLNDPPKPVELSELRWDTAKNIYSLPIIEKADYAIGIGGTITTLAAIKSELAEFDPEKIENTSLSKDDIESLLNRLSKLSAGERSSIPGMEKGREDIIMAGTAILLEFMNYYKLDSITVSAKGVRYGYLMSKI